MHVICNLFQFYCDTFPKINTSFVFTKQMIHNRRKIQNLQSPRAVNKLGERNKGIYDIY